MTTTTAVTLERPLPQASTDRARLYADLDVHGYCVVAYALSAAQVDALRSRLI
jgi:hypothetical protein